MVKVNISNGHSMRSDSRFEMVMQIIMSFIRGFNFSVMITWFQVVWTQWPASVRHLYYACDIKVLSEQWKIQSDFLVIMWHRFRNEVISQIMDNSLTSWFKNYFLLSDDVCFTYVQFINLNCVILFHNFTTMYNIVILSFVALCYCHRISYSIFQLIIQMPDLTAWVLPSETSN